MDEIKDILDEYESITSEKITSGTLQMEILNKVREGIPKKEILNYCLELNKTFNSKEFKLEFLSHLQQLTSLLVTGGEINESNNCT